MSPSGNPIGTVDKDEVKKRILEEAKNIRIRKSEGKYNYDNPDIEHKSSWQKKNDNLEKKYEEKGMSKISIHVLDDEGNLKYMQIKRDRLMTTLGWSFCGNIFGVFVAQYIEKNSDKYRNMRYFHKREMMKVGGFALTVILFTLYGFGNAQQKMVREKIKLVEQHSISHSEK